MKIPEKLKLNKFKAVRIPSKSEYMHKFGLVNTHQQFTGDDIPPASDRKTEQMAECARIMEEYDKQRQKESDQQQ